MDLNWLKYHSLIHKCPDPLDSRMEEKEKRPQGRNYIEEKIDKLSILDMC